jgi:threonine dehydratase
VRAVRAHEFSVAEGLALIPSYDDPRIIAGQGTAGLEIAEDIEAAGIAPDGIAPAGIAPAGIAPDGIAPPGTAFTVLVPIGGGGLAAGVATAIKSLRPEARVYGVEPELAADAQESLREGRIVRWEHERVGRTVADGVRTAALGSITFPHLQAYLDGVLTVSETEICRAMARARDTVRLIVEPSGAVSLAAWLFHADELPADGPVISLLSGGNVDSDTYAELVARGEAAGG